MRDRVIHPLPEGVTVLSLIEQETLHEAGARHLRAPVTCEWIKCGCCPR